MNKKHIAIGILSVLLLTGCTEDKESSFDSTSESEIQTTELTQEPNNEPTNENMTEELLEVEPPFHYPSSPCLMYNGEIYYYIVGSQQVEIDGDFYEIDGEKAFIDAERMKNECEYIGGSISVTDGYVPIREFELTSAASDMPCELYKIDENLILVYSTEEFEIPESYSEWAIVYPGTYRMHWILTKELSTEFCDELIAKYYRYTERFPEDYAQEPESEQNNSTAE